jgi:hypothetical protein
MKYNNWILILALVAGNGMTGCQQQQSADVVETETELQEVEIPTGTFGASITDTGAIDLGQLVTHLSTDEEFEGKILGEIKDVCTKKGCWLTIDLPNGETMRVTFKDYGFFVPKNSQGHPVILEGVATKKTTDVATLRHYAEDAGKSKEEINAITSDKSEYVFEAIGVIIASQEI